MKANELMIGDWVEVIQNGNPAYAQIQMIDGYGDNATYNECICDGIYYNINEIEPIPLTAEILVKNGFADFRKHDEDGMHHFEYCINGMRIDQLADTLFVWICPATDNSILTIKYVHELQHALKLCGIEKEIKL